MKNILYIKLTSALELLNKLQGMGLCGFISEFKLLALLVEQLNYETDLVYLIDNLLDILNVIDSYNDQQYEYIRSTLYVIIYDLNYSLCNVLNYTDLCTTGRHLSFTRKVGDIIGITITSNASVPNLGFRYRFR